MEAAENEGESVQTVEIIKQPGQTLGFYIREGNGVNRSTGVFISRIAYGSVVAKNGLLRVNDEILSVNSVDVTHMSLDDVVILMSIAKCLVLTVRFQKPLTLNAVVSGAAEQGDNNDGRREQPVVVLKSGFANSFSGFTVEDRSPDEYVLNNDILGRYGDRLFRSQVMSMTGSRQDGQFRMPGNSCGDQSLDPRFLSKVSRDLQHSGYGLPERVGQSGLTYGDASSGRYNAFAPNSEFGPQTGVMEKVIRSGKNKQLSEILYQSPRACQGRHVDYASDTDVTYNPSRTPYEQLMSRCSPYKGASLNSGHGYPDHSPRHHNSTRDAGSSYCFNGNFSNKQYSSDSEIITNYHRSSRGGGLNPRPSGVHVQSHRGEGSEIFYSLPHRSREEYKDFRHGVHSIQPDLSQRGHMGSLKTAGSFADVRAGYGGDTVMPVRKNKLSINSSTTDEYVAWLNLRSASAAANASSSRGQTFSSHHLTRKMSTDSLLDHKTYQMEDVGSGGHCFPESKRTKETFHAPDLQCRGNEMHQSRSCAPLSTMTLSRAQHGMGKNAQMNTLMSSMSLNASDGSRSKGVQLAKMPLKIQTETFYPCPTGDSVIPSSGPGIDGILSVRLFCGHGLKSSRTALRDLYCVIEVNGTNRARTMIRTGAINFDWDEEFEIDVEGAKRLAFLVYSWDPHTRHTLGFSGVLSLVTVLQQARYQRLAVKLEPKGTLYVELSYMESSVTLLRKPSVRWNGVFGVDLKALVCRENSGFGVPLVVMRCVEEVERRGLDHIGLYRLCGSARRKLQLKEELERNVQYADLSVEAVTDVNVITSLLKDFLRELPEPLCSNALYQMLLDALSVQVPGDHEGNTQLMLGILECLPRVNQETLSYLLNHLKRVAMKSDANKMTTLNLAICLGPALICPSTENDLPNSPPTMNFTQQIELLRYLLDIWTEHQTIPAKKTSEAGHFLPPHRSSSKTSRSPVAGGILPSRSVAESSHDSRTNKKQEQEDALAWENAETSPC